MTRMNTPQTESYTVVVFDSRDCRIASYSFDVPFTSEGRADFTPDEVGELPGDSALRHIRATIEEANQ